MNDAFGEVMRNLEELKALDAADSTGLQAGATPLSGECLNMNCDFFFYFLTCKQFNINMDKICASYFVGMIVY